ncbi:MAG TPA: heat-inducible transcriptional repressor HrcA [Actinomycetota bacterium]|nr:heat-inducible transcriptional repressor HrcA [Actinomycetota bacterium]
MAEGRTELGPRKAAVLHAIVEEYVRSGEPVGSETIAEAAGLGVSSATIRNEMAALEELGFLTHPHTSAGRIPTDAGYRHYVDAQPHGVRLRDAHRRAIAGYFAEAILDLEEVLKGSVQLLSRLTQYAGLAVPPGASEEPIVRVELIDMGPTVMILAVGQHGRVDKRVIDRPGSLDADGVASIGTKLQSLQGLTYLDAQAQLLHLAAEASAIDHDLLLHVAETLRTASQGEGATHVVVGGVSNLTDEAQAWRRQTLRRLVETLEREQEMLRVLQDVTADREDLWVTIGTEHPTTGEWEASIVTAPFRAGEATVGTIGVVGPTRMDYLSAMASVRAVAKRLSEVATEHEA